MTMSEGFDEAAFHQLQQRLVPMWPGMTLRSVDQMSRALIVVSSVSMDIPTLAPVLPAYEERYLFMVLALARSSNTHVVYVTSQPMLPRLVDYYLSMVPDADLEELRERLSVVAVGDGSARPLTEKILARPRLIERLRQLVKAYEHTLLLPFMTTALEAQLALKLNVPLYGSAPNLTQLGTKTGSREVFASAGVPMPPGVHGIRTEGDIVDAVKQLHDAHPAERYAIKTDDGVGGLGNALVVVTSGHQRTIEECVAALTPEDKKLSREDFLEMLVDTGGVVEEWVEGDEVSSPSVQLRASPLGEVEVLSTHDQVLGGSTGQTFLGCTFPARSDFVPTLTKWGRAIGEQLAHRGVIGRFGIDFLMVRTASEWRPYAIEINLRNGGTTHPALTLLALTGGDYDEESGDFVTRTGPKHYFATDYLHRPEYAALTPDDVLDLMADSHLGWNEDSQTGVALHMVSAIAVAGRLGATAIANSPDAAQELYTELVNRLDRAVAL